MRLSYFFTAFLLLSVYSCLDESKPSLSNNYVDRFIGIDSLEPFQGFGEPFLESTSKKKPQTDFAPTQTLQCPHLMSVYLPPFPTKLVVPMSEDIVTRTTLNKPDWDLQYETLDLVPNGLELTPQMKNVCLKMEEGIAKGDKFGLAEGFVISELRKLIKNGGIAFLTAGYYLSLPKVTSEEKTVFWLTTSCSRYALIEPMPSDKPYVNVIHYKERCTFSLQNIGLHEDEQGTFAVAIDGEFQFTASDKIKLTIKKMVFNPVEVDNNKQ